MKIETLKKIVKDNTNVNIDVVSRKREYTEARGIFYKIARLKEKLSYHKISDSVNKNHATVIYSVRNFEYWMKSDKELEKLYNKTLQSYNMEKLKMESIMQLKSESVQQLKIESPELFENYVKIAEEQFELFCKKQLDYGINNISTGANMETKTGKGFALNGLWFRMNDKINRWKNLMVKKRSARNEPLKDTFQDLANYSIICQLVEKGLWKE